MAFLAVLVMILRLRQLCSHPALIQEGNAKAGRKINTHAELRRAVRAVGAQFVTEIRTKYLTNAVERGARGFEVCCISRLTSSVPDDSASVYKPQTTFPTMKMASAASA